MNRLFRLMRPENNRLVLNPRAHKSDKNKGFSLIELLVVVAIIGILAAVGVVGYQGYIDATKDEASLANSNSVQRAFDQDYISIKNDIGGPSQIASTVTRDTQCLSYVKTSVTNLNAMWKNAHSEANPYAVNLHKDPDNTSQAVTTLKPGQLGIQCANPSVNVQSSDFFVHRCTCVGTESCDLHTFTSGTSSQIVTDYETEVALANRWRTDGTIKLGPHIPDWVCPKADYYN